MSPPVPLPTRRQALALVGSCLSGSVLGGESPLRFGYFDRYDPLSRRVLDDRADGLLVQLVATVLGAAGLAGEHFAFPWPRTQAMVADGRLDGFCTMRTPERERYAMFCQTPLLEEVPVLVHRRDDDRFAALRRLEDLRNLPHLRLGTYRGDSLAQLLIGLGLLKLDDGPDSVIRRISLGDLDAFIEGTQITRTRLKRLGLQEQLSITPLRFLPKVLFRIGLRRSLADAPSLIVRLEEAAQTLRRHGSLPQGD